MKYCVKCYQTSHRGIACLKNRAERDPEHAVDLRPAQAPFQMGGRIGAPSRGRLVASGLGTLGVDPGEHCPPRVCSERRLPAGNCGIFLLSPL